MRSIFKAVLFLLACTLLHSSLVMAQNKQNNKAMEKPAAEVRVLKMLKAPADAKKLAASIMEQVVKNRFGEAFALAVPYCIVPESEMQVLALQTKDQRSQYGGRYGQSVGYELVQEKKAGESLLKLVFIEKTEKHALPWIFVFYRTPSGWVLNSLNWNDQVETVF